MILRGKAIPTLTVSPAALAVPFPLSFEELAAELETWPRLYFEPDGSFVWTGKWSTADQTDTVEPAVAVETTETATAARGAGREWQLNGQVFDREGKLLYVELRGACPTEEWTRLLRCLGWPETALIAQLLREAVFVEAGVWNDER